MTPTISELDKILANHQRWRAGEKDSKLKANLSGAFMAHMELADRDFTDVDLSGADWSYAKLTNLDFSGANIEKVNFRRAILKGIDLESAKIDGIRKDVYAVLDSSPNEVPTLLSKLQAGRIDGQYYETECACLIGTLAKARDCSYTLLTPNYHRLAEVWFLALCPGDTPLNNPIARLTERWILQWVAAQAARER